MSGRPAGHQPSTQLEFTQAMSDFKTMFPNMDTDVIEAVLRSNNGAVDATIDQLLTMTADLEEDKPPPINTPSPPDYLANPPTYNQALRNETSNPNDLSDLLSASSIGPPDILSNLDQHGATGGGAFANGPLWSAKGWKPPILTPLPPDFLRVKKLKQGHAYTHPNHRPEHHSPFNQEMLRERMSENEKKLGSLTSHSDLADLQMLEDEKFALMLQNEEFMAELRVNDEFLSALHEDHESGQPIEFSSKKSHGHGHHMDDAAFKEKLKNMGKTSKQKFAKLAMMFRQRGGNRLLGHAPAPSKDNLLLDAENYVEQQDSDSEEEKHSTTKGRKYQLM